MSTKGISNCGRSIIMETLEKYKNNETIMVTDYEVAVKAITAIPTKTICIFEESKQSENQESKLAMEQTK